MADNFIARHRPEWDELESLVKRARKSTRKLTADDLSRLDVLYRRTSTHLAQAATRTTDRGLIQYLNDLTASAHSIIYLPPRRKILSAIPQFYLESFPRSVARLGKFHLAAALLLTGGALMAYFAVQQDPMNAYALMIGDDTRHPGASREQLLEVLRSGRDQSGGAKFTFASFLFSHNLKVGILAMATGALAAIPTVILTLYNGLMVGAYAAVHHQAGIRAEFWAWILPHGITELLAIVLCSGAGLKLGASVISPGLLTRAESLRRAGEEAIRTVGGVALMLLAAAIIESYLRQSHLSQTARLVFATGSALVLAFYFGMGYYLEKNQVTKENRPDAEVGPAL